MTLDMSTMTGPSKRAGPRGWQPLPYIHSGFVVHPYHPLPPASTPRTPLFNPAAEEEGTLRQSHDFASTAATANPYEIPLDIGDEFFAFEEYKCSLEEDGRGDVWFRGYVVQAVNLTTLSSSSSSPNTYPKPEPSVLIGIFPSSCVHVRPDISVDDGSLSAAYEAAVRLADEDRGREPLAREMEAVKEEDEEEDEETKVRSPKLDPKKRSSVVVGGVVDIPAGSSLTRRQSLGSSSKAKRPKSLILDKAQTILAEEGAKEQPPLPRLTAGDSTIAGQQWPLVDEIACAIREWSVRLPTYLANREYRLFSTVTQHIDALLLGRRQLLSQTLSGGELNKVRRECVSRLAKCNVAQGLEVIVRNLDDGSVMVTDKDKAYAGATWTDGITCYVRQAQFAYIDVLPLDKSPTLFTRLNSDKASRASPSHHLLLDFKAFIASPCAPGETAELFFSLYNQNENRFITEEFHLVLNHLGSPARDSEQRLGRLKTLFTELKPEDLSNHVYLVCKVVRNGALKMRSEAMAGTLDSQHRSGMTRSRSGNLLGEMGTIRENVSNDALTEDSFSVTSGSRQVNALDRTMTSTESIVDGRPSYRRPLGCAVIEMPLLSKLVSDAQGTEVIMPIYIPRDEASFATLHEDVIHRRFKEFYTTSRAESIAISLKVFTGVTSHVIQSHPSILIDVPITSRLGFPDVPEVKAHRNDLYVKLWSANFFPAPSSNGGSIRGRKTIPANHGNVQVTVEARTSDGTLIPDAMFAGGSGEGATPYYHSLVFYNNDKPTLGELIKVSLPTTDCHLFLTFRSRGKSHSADLEKPFAYAYLPLITVGSCIDDGSHDLPLHRMERSFQPAPSAYLSGVSDGMLRDKMVIRTYLCSNVVSQDKTLQALFTWQGHSIDDLSPTLQMLRFVAEEELAKFIPRILDSLFGIMAASLGERQVEIDDQVLQCLIKVLSMNTDRRFPNFGSVLEQYITQDFNHPTSSFNLLRSMKTTMSKPNTQEYRSFLKVWHLFFRFIVRSRELDRAKGIGLDATSAHIEADFQRQTKAILGEINTLMVNKDKNLIGTQAVAVQHYADILPDLAQVFPKLEIAEMIIDFVDKLTYAQGSIAIYKLSLLVQVVDHLFDTKDTRALLVPAIVRWVKPHLGKYNPGFALKEAQSVKDARQVKWLECNRLAITVIACMVTKLQEWHSSPVIFNDASLRAQEEDNLEYCLTLLPSLFQSHAELASQETKSLLLRNRSSAPGYKTTPDLFPSSHPFNLIVDLPPPSLLNQNSAGGSDIPASTGSFNSGLAECTTVLVTLILVTPRQNVTRWLLEVVDFEGPAGTSIILQSAFTACRSILQHEAFPAQWLSLHLMCLEGMVRLLEVVSEVVETENFVPAVNAMDSFDIKLWTTLFELICELAASDELVLEDQGQQRRRAQWIIAGDLRDQTAALLHRLWNAIGWLVDQAQPSSLRYGGYQTRLTNLAGRILGLCLSGHDAMCETAVEILFSMIYAEYVLDGKFESIQTEIFAKLDTLFLSKAPTSDPTLRAYFVAQLRVVFEDSPQIDSTFHSKVGSFLDEIELFIDLLLTLRDLPEDSITWKDEKSLAVYRLMLFAKRTNRLDLYIQFTHQLIQISLANKDWLSAGNALRMHAELYEWRLDGGLLGEFKAGTIDLPIQNHFGRKESLYYHAIDYLAEAEAYESALELCQEMVVQHQRLTFTIPKLSELLVYQARLWEKIGSTSRPKPEYFRVAYFGEVNPLDKGKDYIVRGQPWERYSDFCETIQQKFPSAMIHRSKIPPPESVRLGDEPVVWVTSVIPEPDMNVPALADGVAENVQNHWRYNNIKAFSSQRPYLRDTRESETVLSWMEKTILTTADVLPGVLNRSEVVDIRYEQIAPISNALSEIAKATKTLKALIQPRTGAQIDIKLLGNTINGAVDSPVNGGVKLYQSTFLIPAYLENNPGDAIQVQKLRSSIIDYVKAISDAMDVHRLECRDPAFHEALRSHFHRAFPDEIAQISSGRSRLDRPQLDAPLPPLPSAGHSDMASSLQIPSITHTDPARLSTMSFGTTSAYILPALKLGPSRGTTPIPASNGIEITNGSLDHSRGTMSLPQSPSLPTTSTSSPRHSVLSTKSPVRSLSRNAASFSAGTGGPKSSLHRDQSVNGSVRGGPAGRDVAGSVRSSRDDSISFISEGTVGDYGNNVTTSTIQDGGQIGKKDTGTASKSRLKRFSTLIRR